MAFSPVQSINNSSSGVLTFGTGNQMVAGNLIVFWFAWEDSTGSGGISSVTASNGDTVVLLPATGSDATCHQQFGYVLASVGEEPDTAITYTPSYPTGAGGMFTVAWEFSYSTTNGAMALDVGDDEGTNTGTGQDLTSGSVTLATAGESELVLAGGNTYTAAADTAFDTEQINSVNATGSVEHIGTNRLVLFYRIVTSTFTGTATAHCNKNDAWGCHLIAFKEAAAGGASSTPSSTPSMFRGMFSGMFRGVRVPLIG